MAWKCRPTRPCGSPTFILIDGKMRGLFSLLFGAEHAAGDRAGRGAGRSPAEVHYSRMFWLLVLGCVHYYLIWFGDILTLYAVTGMIAFAFRKSSVRTLVDLRRSAFLVLDLIVMSGISWQFFSRRGGGARARRERRCDRRVAGHERRVRATRQRDRWPRSSALYRGSWLGIVHDAADRGT